MTTDTTATLTGHAPAPGTDPIQRHADRLLVRALIDDDSAVLANLDDELQSAVATRLTALVRQAQRQAWRHPAPAPQPLDDNLDDERPLNDAIEQPSTTDTEREQQR